MQLAKSKLLRIVVLALACVVLTGMGGGGRRGRGLEKAAKAELSDAGVDKYLGQFTPVATSGVGDGWTKHTFDPAGGTGPICIAGTAFSAFTREGDSKNLLIFEQGGGACWQGFYNCNVLSEAQEPPGPPTGIFDFDSPDNPFADYSIVYMPYCDGSVFTGDKDVFDKYKPVLDSIGDQAYYVGPIGSGSIAKLVHNCTGYIIQAAMAETFTMGVKAS